MKLVLIEDRTSRGWFPFADTRPTGELLFGTLLLRERIERAVGAAASGVAGCPDLEGFDEEGAPPVLPREALARGAGREPVLMLLARYLPPAAALAGGGLPLPERIPEGGLRLLVEGETAGWLLAPGGAPAGGRRTGELRLPGALLPDLWRLMSENAEQVARDLEVLPGLRPAGAREGVHRIGGHAVSEGEGVVVEPGAVLDATQGPIHLAAGVRVRSLSRVEGPAWIGPGTVIGGGVVAGVSIGPVCRIHGEVQESVVLGYANKAHDGYLGHAILGRWVNLGAGTTNSDLKNNYGTVRVAGPGGVGEVDTGLRKVGVALGDHVKTGIGTLLTTGTMVGAGSNLFGGRMPPRTVPPFSWGAGSELAVHRLDRFVETARIAMGRRGVELSEAMEGVLARAWERTRGE